MRRAHFIGQDADATADVPRAEIGEYSGNTDRNHEKTWQAQAHSTH